MTSNFLFLRPNVLFLTLYDVYYVKLNIRGVSQVRIPTETINLPKTAL